MKLKLTNYLFRIKDLFFKNDISTFWSTFLLYISGIIFYWGFRYIGDNWFSLTNLSFPTFLSIWTSFTGMLLAFFVMLNINNEKTKSGRDFIDLISTELYRLEKDEEITILTPNLNIGSYKYRGESIFEQALKKACSSNAKIHFITLAIDKKYIMKYKNIEISDRVNHLKNGKDNKSHQLSYIYERYIQPREDEEESDDNFWYKLFKRNENQSKTVTKLVKDTFDELTWCLEQDNITITHCNNELEELKFVGFFTKNKFYIANYKNLQSEKGKVSVAGELITTKEVIKVYSEYILDKYNNFKVTDESK